MTNPVSLPLVTISLRIDYAQHFFISHTIGPTDLHPSSAPHFKSLQVKLIKTGNYKNKNFIITKGDSVSTLLLSHHQACALS
jgi:hypothetical protein